MNKRDIKFFELAKVVSESSDHHRFKIGTVIAYKNKVIAIGTNSDKTHPVQKIYDRYRHFPTRHNIHAEIRAILNSKLNDLSGCSIYTYRETKAGKPANSRPCPSCLQMIMNYGIKRICYCTEIGYCVEELK